MLFNSVEFLLFFVALFALYFSLPHRFRWVLLLVASYAFYLSWEPSYTVLLAALTAVNYFAALAIARADGIGKKKVLLAFSILTSGGLLFFFKYLGFFSGSLGTLFASLHVPVTLPALSLALPVGISFYTLKIMSYTIDVYRGKRESERHLGFFALYVSFFPQLIAGPIDRATNLLPQFHVRHDFDYQRVTDGLKLMLWGFFQKMVIADTLAVMVDRVFNNSGQYGAPVLALAALLFTFQIYCDFSGYSDIAIGIARVFGFSSMINFERPYFSRSIPEFWRRWHISLSTWFRDYLYISLGGKRVSVPRWYMNLMIVFLVSGLWHGANWTFVVWGALHGCFYLVSVMTQGARDRISALSGLSRMPRLHQGLQIFITFCLTAFAWIFFRANTISDAFSIVGRIFTGWGKPGLALSGLSAFITAHFFEFFVGVAGIIVMEAVHCLQEKGQILEMLRRKPVALRWAVYYGLLAAVLLFGSFGARQFIYFQF